MKEHPVVNEAGKIITYLSPTLVEKQKVTPDQLEALKLSHLVRDHLFEEAKKVLREPLKLKLLAVLFDHLETEQQKLWNFEPNSNFHRFFDFPGCKCPKLDNADRLGTRYKIFQEDCPIHGWKEQPTKQANSNVAVLTEGYNNGYLDGRTKNTPRWDEPGFVQLSKFYQKGYTNGFNHGKGHKAKFDAATLNSMAYALNNR